MGKRQRTTAAAGLAAALAIASISLAARVDDQDSKAQESKRPKLTLKAQPAYGVSPARIVMTAELVGGGELEEYYCPTVRWDWDDDTSSESTVDCPPYQAGKTELKRRFTVEHVFKQSGSYKVFVRLKQKDKEIAAASTMVQVQPGAGLTP